MMGTLLLFFSIVKLRFTIETRAAGMRALIAPSAHGLALLVYAVFFRQQSHRKNGFHSKSLFLQLAI